MNLFDSGYEELSGIKDIDKVESVLPSISSLLPYQVFDESEALYINDKSYGFLLEVTPLCGASKDIVNILTGMITDGVPEGCGIQVINWASPKVGGAFEKWRNSRNSAASIYKKLADKRIKFFEGKNWKSLFTNPFLIRDFRVFVAVSIPINFGNSGKKSLIALKDQLKTTLQSSGMKSKELLPDAFLSLIYELVNPDRDVLAPKIKWNKLDPLKNHISDYEQIIHIKPSGLVLQKVGHEPIEIRGFSTRSFPEVWAQWYNRDLIGDFYSDFLRIPCPFLTVFSFIYGDEDAQNNSANIKSIRATQQASSGIAGFMPSVKEIDKDWKFVTDKLKKGQKLVKAIYQVVIYADTQEVENCERYVRSLYKSKGWNLNRDQYVHLQTWLTAMPFTISEGLGDDLSKFSRMKSMVTWSCANLAPLQGEWKGMESTK